MREKRRGDIFFEGYGPKVEVPYGGTGTLVSVRKGNESYLLIKKQGTRTSDEPNPKRKENNNHEECTFYLTEIITTATTK